MFSNHSVQSLGPWVNLGLALVRKERVNYAGKKRDEDQVDKLILPTELVHAQ